jgi:glutamine amidotransferase
MDHKRIPHVGWNSVELTREHYLFEGVKKGVDFYFVHSYYFDAYNPDDVLAYCNYGINFPAIVSKDNVIGIQFHPEKSQKNGLKILENFCMKINA